MSHQEQSQSDSVRLSKSLNEGETKFVQARMVRVEKCLKDNGIIFESNNVPHIAVLGSGGGERAMIGLLGCIDQLYKTNLLDSILYLCGVSGSTWCMTSMYEDAAWSSKVPSVIDDLVKRLTETDIDVSESIKWLSQAVEDEHFSLTDFWAATVVYGFVKKINTTCLSDLKNLDATNPYPIYTVNDQGIKDKGNETACWFELSPHEVGYTHVGAFVDTSSSTSQFEAGVLKQKTVEKDMLYLQGLCGSALADGEENVSHIKNSIWQWLKHIFKSGSEQKAKVSAENKKTGKPKAKGKGGKKGKGKEKKNEEKEKKEEKEKIEEKEKKEEKEEGGSFFSGILGYGNEEEKEEKEKEVKEEGGSFFSSILGYGNDDKEEKKDEKEEEGGSFFGSILGYGNDDKEEKKDEKEEEGGSFFSSILGYGNDDKEEKKDEKEEEGGSFFGSILGYGNEEEHDDDDDDEDDEEGGSFFGNMVDTFLDYVPLDDLASEAVESILDLFDCDDEEESAKHVQKLQKSMSGVKSENANKPAKSIAGKSKEEKHDSLAEYALDALDAFKYYMPGLSDVTKITLKTMSLLSSWTWGTKYNFLYKCPSTSTEAEVPEEALSDERTHLEDAGLVMNSPYVAALRPDRKVKLILSFDFSAGDPFMTVTQAAEYCKQTGIPFPPVEISEEDRMQPKDFYVFKSENTPTVIHIPLFNMVNCEGDVAKWRETYPTFRNAYDRETMDELIRVSGLNVANNKKRILQEISDVCK